MKSLIMAGFLAVASAAVYGEEVSILNQIDAARGSGPTRTTALFSKYGELWHYGGAKLVEVGRLKVADAGKGRLSLVGGYASFSEKFDNVSLEAFAIHDRQVGDWHLHAAGGFYTPRSDGSCGWIGFSPETRLTRSVGKGIEVGVAADAWWIEGLRLDVRVGPYARTEGKEGAFALRYFPEDRVLRIEICAPIK